MNYPLNPEEIADKIPDSDLDRNASGWTSYGTEIWLENTENTDTIDDEDINVEQIAKEMSENISIPDGPRRRRQVKVIEDKDYEISFDPYRFPREKVIPRVVKVDTFKPRVQKNSIQESKMPSFGEIGKRQLDI